MKTIILELDEIDYQDVMSEIARHEAMSPLPDGRGNVNGRVVAELVRDLREYRDLYDSESSEGEEWKDSI